MVIGSVVDKLDHAQLEFVRLAPDFQRKSGDIASDICYSILP
jgi:hypothetical protein